MKVHLVDGTYELFRNHFGAPEAKTPGGEEVGAVRGLFRTLVALLRQPEVTHVAVAFDHTVRSFRNDLLDVYKTGDGVEQELLGQFPIAELVAEALGIVVWPMIEFEADDALATGALKYGAQPEVEQVLICTPDKDLYQSVRGDAVCVLDRRRKVVLNEAAVIEKIGVSPALVPDYLGLVGDAADGIPGVPRWGARSSAVALNHFGSIEAIPLDPAEWDVKVRGAKGLCKSLAERREDALLYKRVATLRTDVPLAETFGDLRYRGPDAAAMAALAERIGAGNVPTVPDGLLRDTGA